MILARCHLSSLGQPIRRTLETFTGCQFGQFWHINGTRLKSALRARPRASALRADGVSHTRPLLVTQWTRPTPWTRPQIPLGPNSSLTIRLLKKDKFREVARALSLYPVLFRGTYFHDISRNLLHPGLIGSSAFESLLCVGKISVTTHPLVLLHCHSFCVHLPSNLAITHLYEPCIITHIPQTAVPRVAQIFRHIP